MRKTSVPTVAPARGTGIIQQPAALQNLDAGRKYNGWTERKTSAPTEAVPRATGIIQLGIFGTNAPEISGHLCKTNIQFGLAF